MHQSISQLNDNTYTNKWIFQKRSMVAIIHNLIIIFSSTLRLILIMIKQVLVCSSYLLEA
jgi:hypothetical protein